MAVQPGPYPVTVERKEAVKIDGGGRGRTGREVVCREQGGLAQA